MFVHQNTGFEGWTHDAKHGGETNLDNAALLCRHHHTKTHHGWTLHRHPDHTYDTTPPPPHRRTT